MNIYLFLKCFDTTGWVTGREFVPSKTSATYP